MKEEPQIKNCCGVQPTDINEMTQRSDQLKKSLASRLNRVEGQIRGIRKMIENDSYCDDVLNQVSAASAALDGISKLVLENHIRNCVAGKIKRDDSKIIDELINTIGKLL